MLATVHRHYGQLHPIDGFVGLREALTLDCIHWRVAVVLKAQQMEQRPQRKALSCELIKVPKSFCRRILVLAVFIAAHSAFAQEEYAARGCAFPAFGWPT